jgi:hypothetical protein
MDPTTILVDNLHDALNQVSQYLGLGLVAAISALVLDRAPAPDARETEKTDVPGFFAKMPRHVAQLVLLGVYFVAGIMAYIATESALTILPQLSAPIRSAACTQASIVTSAIGYRVIAAVLPIMFVLPILWRQWKRVRAISRDDSNGVVALTGFFMVPYLALGLALLRVQCDS